MRVILCQENVKTKEFWFVERILFHCLHTHTHTHIKLVMFLQLKETRIDKDYS